MPKIKKMNYQNMQKYMILNFPLINANYTCRSKNALYLLINVKYEDVRKKFIKHSGSNRIQVTGNLAGHSPNRLNMYKKTD